MRVVLAVWMAVLFIFLVGILWGVILFGDSSPKAPRECIQQSHSVSQRLTDEGWIHDSRTTYTGQCTILGGVE